MPVAAPELVGAEMPAYEAPRAIPGDLAGAASSGARFSPGAGALEEDGEEWHPSTGSFFPASDGENSGGSSNDGGAGTNVSNDTNTCKSPTVKQSVRRSLSATMTPKRMHMSRTSSSSGTLTPPVRAMKRHSMPAMQVAGSPRRPSSMPRHSLAPTPSHHRNSSPGVSGLVPPTDRAKGDVSVCVRLRPGPRHEMCIFKETPNCVRMRGGASGRSSSGSVYEDMNREANEAIYWCDHAFGPDTAQESVYEHAVGPICDAVLEGYNGAVIAYGQTGSGKTHTIIGDSHNQGVIPRVVQKVFSALEVKKHWSVEVSVLEIYNEKTRDLLAPGQAVVQVDIHEVTDPNGTSSFRCPDATRRKAKAPEEAMNALYEGLRRRETACTDMNHNSSRSHLIFTLSTAQSDDALKATLRGQLHLVDLAGSERLKRSMVSGGQAELSKTPREREQRREAGAINKSLAQLALVIYRLTQGGALKHVPYRDSMLTRLLADSFGGSSKTCLIITCSALIRDREETRCALEFGKRANLVKNVAEINIEMQQDPSDVVKALVAKELANLKREREDLRCRMREAAEEALNQQKLRVQEVQKLEEEKEALEHRWLQATHTAAEIQEESAEEIARLREEQQVLHYWLQEVSGELVELEREKAFLHQQLVEAMHKTSQQAAAAAARMEEAVAIAESSRARHIDFSDKNAEKGAALRRSLDLAAADTETRARIREGRLATLTAEAGELRQRWGPLLRIGRGGTQAEPGAEDNSGQPGTARVEPGNAAVPARGG